MRTCPTRRRQSFSDVPSSFWAFKYIEYCKAQYVVHGYPDGTYQPGELSDGDQMAVFVARASICRSVTSNGPRRGAM